MKGILKKIQSKSVPIAGIFVSIYILFLGLTNRLIFYIHPDYKWLAFTMSTILLVVSVFGLFFYHSHGKRNIFSRFVLVPALFVILIGVVIEPASLTSNTALRRGIDDDNSVLTPEPRYQQRERDGDGRVVTECV